MNYWLFQCNPKLYRIEDRLNDPNPKITWKVSRYQNEIKCGDIAFIWRAGDERGVVGAMRLQSDPHLMREIESELPFRIGEGEYEEEKQIMVKAELIARTNLPADELRTVRELKRLSLLHPPYQGTNFRVSQTEGRMLMELIGGQKNA